jgi:hypothetical protein
MNDFDKGRLLFIVTFIIDEPPMDGQAPRAINVPAFVADWQTAADRAKDYLAAFPSTPEARQLKGDAKLKLQSIMLGGTILT